jgi:Cys-rich four helix bundle protein (predicted Tat secretion target)
MNRRDALLTTGSMFVSASLGSLACGGATAGAQNAKAAPPGGAGSPAGLADVAAECLTKGAACVGHCLGMLGAGDTSMAGCARTSYDMTVAMEALAKLAASGSPHLPAFAKLSADFCRDCVVECQKHADKHAVCKECLDACTRTISACESVPG